MNVSFSKEDVLIIDGDFAVVAKVVLFLGIVVHTLLFQRVELHILGYALAFLHLKLKLIPDSYFNQIILTDNFP